MILHRHACIALTLCLLAGCATSSTPPASQGAGARAGSATPQGLAGTSWQLVRRVDGDGGAVTVPDDPSHYTLAFGADGGVNVRIDCNRGHATWSAPQAGSFNFGELALTRALCAPSTLNDRLASDWPALRRMKLDNGHLVLTTTTQGDAYEWQPLAVGAATP